MNTLDKSASEFDFPGFDNANYHLGTARISGFRDSTRWALVFELVVWWPAADGITPVFFVYGNCLDQDRLAFPGQTSWQQGMVFWHDTPISTSFDENGEVCYDSVVIRGQPVPLSAEQVAPQPEVPERGFAIMVHLLATYRDRLLATAEELARLVPPDLPQILSLDSWQHPLVYQGELPGQNHSLRKVAAVLCSGDLSDLGAPADGNVDWRLWLAR